MLESRAISHTPPHCGPDGDADLRTRKPRNPAALDQSGLLVCALTIVPLAPRKLCCAVSLPYQEGAILGGTILGRCLWPCGSCAVLSHWISCNLISCHFAHTHSHARPITSVTVLPPHLSIFARRALLARPPCSRYAEAAVSAMPITDLSRAIRPSFSALLSSSAESMLAW